MQAEEARRLIQLEKEKAMHNDLAEGNVCARSAAAGLSLSCRCTTVPPSAWPGG
jgi:hypothetical protein